MFKIADDFFPLYFVVVFSLCDAASSNTAIKINVDCSAILNVFQITASLPFTRPIGQTKSVINGKFKSVSGIVCVCTRTLIANSLSLFKQLSLHHVTVLEPSAL